MFQRQFKGSGRFHHRGRCCVFLLLVVGTVFFPAPQAGSASIDGIPSRHQGAGELPQVVEPLDARGVVALLDVMDVVASIHPGFQQKEELYRQLADAARDSVFEMARGRNEESNALETAVGALLATDAYQVYLRRFSNVTAEVVRDLLLDLPYRERAGPGQIGRAFFLLMHNRLAARSSLNRVLTGLNMNRVHETAMRWSPAGAGPIPTMFLIYDSNAGSFAAEGKPFFNLYSGFGLEFLNGDISDSTLRDAQATMAHELQHVVVEPYLYPEQTEDQTWQQEWIDRLTRGMVSEGVANHCNPPAGFKKEIYEAPAVVAALVRRLNDLLVALDRNEMTEEEIQAWYRSNYFEVAEGLLRHHLANRYSGDELERRYQEQVQVRPDLEHTLGWWMVSRVSRDGIRVQLTLSLLSDPYSLYSLYNDAVGANEPEMLISDEAMQYVASLRSAATTRVRLD